MTETQYSENPHIYGVKYAYLLSIGVDAFNQDLSNLDEAESILLKYPDNQEALDLLEDIKQLREERTSE